MLNPSLARANSLVMIHPDVPLRPGTIARLTGESSRTVTLSALHSLTREGILRRTEVVGHEAYEPETKSPYYQAAYLTALVDLPIDAAFANDTVIAVFVFGSIVRRGAGRESDIDLLVIGRVADERLTRRRLADVGERYGRRVDVTFTSVRDLRAALENRDPFLSDAVKTGVLIRGEWE
jgi:predicted nucleotidyltransferase